METTSIWNRIAGGNLILQIFIGIVAAVLLVIVSRETAASAILLGLGGWLVVQGELSLGQLVAAELVLSVVFVGLSQFGVYLTYFYDVCAAIDELSQFYHVEQEEPGADYDFGDDGNDEEIKYETVSHVCA